MHFGGFLLQKVVCIIRLHPDVRISEPKTPQETTYDFSKFRPLRQAGLRGRNERKNINSYFLRTLPQFEAL